MALDARRRQKKVERRAAKQSEKKRAIKRRDANRAAAILDAISSCPILHCCVTDEIWTQGIGQVLVSRLLPGDRVAASILLLDVYCLGVKDATFHVGSRGHYDLEIHGRLSSAFSFTKLQPACARKLVEGAVAFAAGLELAAHPDYRKAKVIFGDIDPGACAQEFAYGREGKPFFAAGPYDSPSRCNSIMRSLIKHCGADGFAVLGPLEASEFLSFEGNAIKFDGTAEV